MWLVEAREVALVLTEEGPGCGPSYPLGGSQSSTVLVLGDSVPSCKSQAHSEGHACIR